MAKSFTFAAGLISIFAIASPVQAAQTFTVSYMCNLNGAPGQLVAQVTAVGDTAVVTGPQGDIHGTLNMGGMNLQYGGTLTSQYGRWSFTGENAFADFTDLSNYSRFHGQFIPQAGGQLILVIAPETQGREQYICQQQGGSAAAGGYPQQGYPQQGTYQPQQPAYPQQGGNGQSAPANLDRLMQAERQDMGVQPTKQLHTGAMHGPTPASIPGGQVVTTKGLVELAQRQVPFVLIDALGGSQSIPTAVPAAWASQSGTFDDAVQNQFVQLLQQKTGGHKEMPIVLFCLSRECWMSYNAALRAINAGYTNVLWYRGGMEAWETAGLPTEATQQGNPQQGYAPQAYQQQRYAEQGYPY